MGSEGTVREYDAEAGYSYRATQVGEAPEPPGVQESQAYSSTPTLTFDPPSP
jgi:hypothetical protein